MPNCLLKTDFILGKATSFILRSFYLREISLAFRPFVTFKHYTRIDGFKLIYTVAIIDVYSSSIKSLIEVKLKIEAFEQQSSRPP